MKKLLILIFLPVLVSAQFAYEGPIPKITSGYGSFGSVPFESAFFHLVPDSTYECEDTLRCIITYPTNATGILPTVFRFPGASNENLTDSVYWNESKLDREFVASNGYVSVTM